MSLEKWPFAKQNPFGMKKKKKKRNWWIMTLRNKTLESWPFVIMAVILNDSSIDLCAGKMTFQYKNRSKKWPVGISICPRKWTDNQLSITWYFAKCQIVKAAETAYLYEKLQNKIVQVLLETKKQTNKNKGMRFLAYYFVFSYTIIGASVLVKSPCSGRIPGQN